MALDLELTATSTKIIPNRLARHPYNVVVQLENVEYDELLNCAVENITIADFIKEKGIADVIDEIGLPAIKEHFGIDQ